MSTPQSKVSKNPFALLAKRALPVGLAGFGLFLAAACGPKHVQKLKAMNEEFFVDATLRESFPTYERLNADNQNLASRIEGASATLLADQELYTKKTKNEALVEIAVRASDKDDEAVLVSSRGSVAADASLRLLNDTQKMDAQAARQYRIMAKCDGAACENLVVLLQECEKPAKVETATDDTVDKVNEKPTEPSADKTADEKKLKSKEKCESKTRYAAMIFQVASDVDSVEATDPSKGQTPKSPTKDSSTSQKTLKTSAPQPANGPRKLVLRWSANVDGSFNSGAKLSIDKVITARAARRASQLIVAASALNATQPGIAQDDPKAKEAREAQAKEQQAKVAQAQEARAKEAQAAKEAQTKQAPAKDEAALKDVPAKDVPAKETQANEKQAKEAQTKVVQADVKAGQSQETEVVEKEASAKEATAKEPQAAQLAKEAQAVKEAQAAKDAQVAKEAELARAAKAAQELKALEEAKAVKAAQEIQAAAEKAKSSKWFWQK